MQKGRKKKVRYIQKMPAIVQFSPRGKPGRPDEIELKVDEFEAIRLADLQGYDQSEGASLMGVSRPSFGRILRNARKVVADALVHGKIIRVRIGDVQVGVRQVDVSSRKPSKSIMRSVHPGRAIEEKFRENIVNVRPVKS